MQYLKISSKTRVRFTINLSPTKITDIINTEILDARQRLYDITQVIFDDISNTVSNYVVSEGLQKNKDEEIKLRITASFISADLWQDVIETRLKTLSMEILKFASLIKLLEDEIGRLS